MKSRAIILMLFAVHMFGMDGGRTTVQGPVAGYVFDQQVRGVRPMLGLPGAAYLGDALVGGLEAAGIAPDGARALVVREGRLFLVSLKGEAGPAPVENAIAGADRFAWSPDGSVAAVYASASRKAQIIRNGAAGEPVVLSGPGEVAALAVTRSGKLIAGVAGENGGVYMDGALLARAANPAAITVAGQDLYFVDKERGQVWQVAGFETDGAALLFAEGMDGAAGVQVYGSRVFVAGAKGIEVFDLTARALLGHLDVDAAPTGLTPFGERALWLLNAPGEGQPAYVLSAAEVPAVYFVPAGREE
ncbi:MAG: hypothetical protein ACE15B_00535 [Bryobacteraceae bacterium]